MIDQVDLDDGKVYRHKVGPGEYLGQVDANIGKVYTHRSAPDQYISWAAEKDDLYRHVPLDANKYLGKIVEMQSLIDCGVAILLFFFPRDDEAV